MRPTVAVALALLLAAAGCTGVDPGITSATSVSPSVATETATATDSVSATPGPTHSTESDSPSATPPSTPKGTPSPTSTGSPRPTPSPTATPTATPSPSPSPSPSPTPSQNLYVRVERVVDGDTLEIRYDNDSTDTVRLLGVDTPEVHAENTPDEWEGVPDTEAGRDCLRAAGHDASDYVTQRLEGERVRLEMDANEGPRGYYGRLLAYVYLDSTHVNYQLVNQGYGRVYDSNFEKRSRFYAAESEAQDQLLGAWECREVSTATPSPTASDGSSSGSLSVVRVHEDAAGNDHENENDEYIVFENTGDSTLDLSGWTVSDEVDHTYSIPSGFSLEPGAQVTLYTGSGQDTDHELYWGSDAAIWNNDGDTVFVHTDDGTQVIRYEY